MTLSEKDKARLIRKCSGKINPYFLEREYPELNRYLLLKSEEENTSRPKELHKILFGKPKCEACNSENLCFINMQKGFVRFCSRKCANNSESSKLKAKQTWVEKYGVDNPLKSKAIQKRFKATMKERYGVCYTAQSKELANKCRKTCIEKYGVDNPAKAKVIQKKMKATCQKLYGVDNVWRSGTIAREKSKTTHLERYGVEHTFQNRELFEKQKISGFQIKEVWLKTKYFRVRGYEDVALHYLYEQLKVKPKNIITESIDGMPSVPWKDKQSKQHWYHPDIYAKVNGVWWLIEVKSTYTCGLEDRNRSMWSVLKQKAKACDEAGYNFVLLVVDKNKVYPLHQPWLKTRKYIKKLISS